MDTYHNSVTDILVLVDHTESTYIQIYGKDHLLKWEQVQTAREVPKILEQNIFSATYQITTNGKFSLVPNEVSKLSGYAQLNLGGDDDIKEYSLPNFKIIGKHVSIADTKRLVGVENKLDVGLILEKLDSSKKSDTILFYDLGGVLTLLVWKQGVFHLANRYVVNSAEEVFYYIMLAAEQLELNAAELDFNIIGSEDTHKKYMEEFKDYLAPLHNASITQYRNSDEEAVTTYLAKCVL